MFGLGWCVPRMVVTAGTVAAALSAAGCGSDEPRQVRATLSRMAHATANKDYHTLCRQVLASNIVAPLEQLGLPCERALGKALNGVEAPRLLVRRIAVHGATASAVVHSSAANQTASDDTVRLVRVGGGQWRVSALGAPAAGAPASRAPARATRW